MVRHPHYFDATMWVVLRWISTESLDRDWMQPQVTGSDGLHGRFHPGSSSAGFNLESRGAHSDVETEQILVGLASSDQPVSAIVHENDRWAKLERRTDHVCRSDDVRALRETIRRDPDVPV